MKRIILSFLLGWMALGLCAQDYKVSTEVQPKNVLLEEFTGINCGYCPEGHKIAEKLKNILGDRISVVAIHYGPFSPHSNDANDFTVPAGDEIGKMIVDGSSGFPNGSVNRRNWLNGKLSYGRDHWEDFARQVVAETAPVNLWATAEVDAESRIMKIRVEGYYTEDLKGETPCLNVLLTQNSISGMQAGGNMGVYYPHQHVLRDAINGAKGEKLEQGKKGEYFVKEYTYRVPEKYKELKAKLQEMELVIFVTEGYKNVLNTITIKPKYIGKDLPLSAFIYAPKFNVDGGYRYNFAEVVVKNKCNRALTSARFEVNLNGEVSISEWEGEIPPLTVQEIRIPVDWNRKAVKKNAFRITLKGLNGVKLAGNYFEGSFGAPIDVPEEVVLKLNMDDFASENTFGLYDMDGKCIKSFGPFKSGETLSYEEKLTLQPNTRYCLEVTDAWGNGYYPHGNAIEILDASGMALYQQYAVKNFGTRVFFQTGVPSGIETDAPALAASKMEVYDLLGKKVGITSTLKDLPKGIYLVRTAKEVRKVIIK